MTGPRQQGAIQVGFFHISELFKRQKKKKGGLLLRVCMFSPVLFFPCVLVLVQYSHVYAGERESAR